MADGNIVINLKLEGLNSLKQNLQAIQNLKTENIINPAQFKDAGAELTKIQQLAQSVGLALEKTYNPTLQTANLTKFTNELSKAGYSLEDVQRGFAQLGTGGQFVLQQLQASVAGVTFQLKQAHPRLAKLAESIGNSIRYIFTTRAVSSFISSVSNAIGFVKKLDTSLNNIRIVTGKSSEEMAKFAAQANKAAKALGASTTDYTNAALIYYQQGLQDEEVKARTDVTVKVANITKQSADEVSEQLTAVWNGYRVTAEEAELYIDKLSAVAAHSASNLEELSTAMSKVASAAAAMGVDIDELTAQIATIVSVTRQDAANVGTALKTIYARMGDLAVSKDAMDEFGVSLGDVSGKLAVMGIDVLDQEGNLRDLGNVIAEVAGKWETWTEAQQQAAAVALAGKRQYNNLIALFNNWDMYQSSLETSQTSEGTLQKQQDTYMDSLEAHLEQLRATGESVYSTLFDTEGIKDLVDAVTWLVKQVNSLFSALGGGMGVLDTLIATLTIVFSSKITDFFSKSLASIDSSKEATIGYNKEVEVLNNLLEEEKNLQGQLATAQDQSVAKQLAATKEQIQYQKNRVDTIKAVRSGRIDTDTGASLLSRNTKLFRQDLDLYPIKQSAATDFGKLQGLQSTFGVDNTKTMQSFFNELKNNDGTLDAFKDRWADIAIAIRNVSFRIDEFKAQIADLRKKPPENLLSEDTLPPEIQNTFGRGKTLTTINDENIGKIKAQQANIAKLERAASEESASDEIKQQLKDAKKSSDEFLNSLVKNKNQFNQLKASAQEYRNALMKVDSTSIDKLVDKTLNLDSVTQEAKNEIQAAYNAYQVAPNTQNFEKVVALLEKAGADTQEFTNNLNKNNEALRENMEAHSNLEASLNKLKPDERAQAITGVITSITSLAASIRSLNSIVDTWGDDSLSTGEKVKQSLMSLITILPMLHFGLTQVSKSFKTLYAEKLADVQATLADGGAHVIAAAGVRAFGAALKSVLVTLLPTIIIIASLTAIIWGIKAAIEAHYNATHKARIAAEEANKAYEEQQKILEDTKKAYDDLKSSIEDYEDAQKAIDELTVGTEEWRDAIIDANQEVLDLLQTYPKLAQYISTDVTTGRLTVSEEGKEAVLQQQQDRIRIAERNAAINGIIRNEAQIAANRETLLADDSRFDDLYDRFAVNLAAYDWTNTVKPVGQVIYDRIVEGLQDPTNPISQMSDSQLRQYVAELAKGSETAPVIIDFVNALKENAQVIAANTKANEILNKTISEERIRDTSEYIDSDFKDALTNVLAQEADKYYNDKLAEVDKIKGKELAQRYVSAMGGENAGLMAEDGKVYRLNADGSKGEEVEIDEGVMRQFIARSLAIDAAKENIGALSAALNVRAENLGVGTDLANIILSQATGTDIDVSQLTGGQRKTLGGTFDTASEEDKKAIDVLKSNYDNQIAVFTRQFGQDIVDRIDENFDIDKITLKVQGKIGSAFYNAFTYGGKEGLDSATAFLQQYSGEELEKVADLLANTDWSRLDAGSQFASALNEAGIEIKNVDSIYNIMMETFKKSRSAVQDLVDDFAKLKEQLQSVYEITSDLEVGGIIDDDDYKQLIGYNAALENLFVLTEEGYKFIGESSKELKKVANDNVKSIEEYHNEIEGAKKEAKQFLAVAQLSADEQKLWGLDLDSSKTKRPDLRTLGILLDNNYADNIIKATGSNKEALQRDQAILMALQQNNEEGNNTLKALLGESFDVTDESARNEAENAAADRIRKFYADVEEVLKRVENNEVAFTDEEQQLIASTAETFDELNSYYEQGVLDFDNYQKAHKAMVLDEVNNLGLSAEEWQAWSKNLAGNAEAAEEQALKTYHAFTTLSTVNLTDTISRQLKQLTHQLSEIQRATEKVFGKQTLGFLEDQQDKQKDLIELQKQNIDALNRQANYTVDAYEIKEQQFLAMIQNSSNEIYKSFNLFDAQGNLIQDEFYKLALAAEDLQDETMLNAIEIFQEYINNVDSAKDAIIDAQDELSSMYDTLHDMTLEEYTLKFQIEIDKRQAQRDFYEFMSKTYNTSGGIGGLTDRQHAERTDFLLKELLTYVADQATSGTLIANLQQMKNAKVALENPEEYLAHPEKYGGTQFIDPETGKVLTEAAEAEWTSKLEAARQSALDILELYQAARDEYMGIMEDLSSDIQKQIDIYEHLQNRISHDMEIIRLLQGDESYRELEGFFEARQNLLLGQINVQQQAMAKWQETMASIEDKTSPEYLYAEEQFMATEQALNQTIESAITNMQDKMKNAMSAVIKEWTDQITDGIGLDRLIQGWDDINQRADRYLDVINSAYQMDKLRNQVDISLEQMSDSLSAQEKLNKFKREEIKILEQKDKLTQYDVDRANLLYQITLKQIALEEAQASATKMKLVRDASGNYSYQFVADQDKIKNAEQELKDLENELYNLDVKEYKDRSSELANTVKEATQELFDAFGIPDAEERNAEITRVFEKYLGTVEGLSEELIAAFNIEDIDAQAAAIVEIFKKNFSLADGGLIGDINYDIDTVTSNLDRLFDYIGTTGKEALGEIWRYYDDFRKSLSNMDYLTEMWKGLAEASNKAKEDRKNLEDYVGSLDELCKKGKDAVKDYANDLENLLPQTLDAILGNFETQMSAIEGILKDLYGLLLDFQQHINEITDMGLPEVPEPEAPKEEVPSHYNPELELPEILTPKEEREKNAQKFFDSLGDSSLGLTTPSGPQLYPDKGYTPVEEDPLAGVVNKRSAWGNLSGKTISLPGSTFQQIVAASAGIAQSNIQNGTVLATRGLPASTGIVPGGDGTGGTTIINNNFPNVTDIHGFENTMSQADTFAFQKIGQ